VNFIPGGVILERFDGLEKNFHASPVLMGKNCF
jgi:hypothetical protein